MTNSSVHFSRLWEQIQINKNINVLNNDTNFLKKELIVFKMISLQRQKDNIQNGNNKKNIGKLKLSNILTYEKYRIS